MLFKLLLIVKLVHFAVSTICSETTSCDPGFEKHYPNCSGPCIQCSNGMFRNGNMDHCASFTQCDGTYQRVKTNGSVTHDNECECYKEPYLKLNGKVCDATCVPGKQFILAKEACEYCPNGTYKNFTGAGACLNCKVCNITESACNATHDEVCGVEKPESEPSQNLSPGGIVGILFCILVLIIILGVVVWCCCCREASSSSPSGPSSEPDGAATTLILEDGVDTNEDIVQSRGTSRRNSCVNQMKSMFSCCFPRGSSQNQSQERAQFLSYNSSGNQPPGGDRVSTYPNGNPPQEGDRVSNDPNGNQPPEGDRVSTNPNGNPPPEGDRVSTNPNGNLPTEECPVTTPLVVQVPTELAPGSADVASPSSNEDFRLCSSSSDVSPDVTQTSCCTFEDHRNRPQLFEGNSSRSSHPQDLDSSAGSQSLVSLHPEVSKSFPESVIAGPIESSVRDRFLQVLNTCRVDDFVLAILVQLRILTFPQNEDIRLKRDKEGHRAAMQALVPLLRMHGERGFEAFIKGLVNEYSRQDVLARIIHSKLAEKYIMERDQETGDERDGQVSPAEDKLDSVDLTQPRSSETERKKIVDNRNQKETPVKEGYGEQNPSEDTPLKQVYGEQNPSRETPLKQVYGEQNPSRETPLKQVYGEENPSKETPLKQVSAENNPSETPLKEVDNRSNSDDTCLRDVRVNPLKKLL